MNNELYHYGIKRRSGRYPYGSGENPGQHESGRHRFSKKEPEDLQTVMRSGNVKKVYDNRHRMTNQQLQESLNRIDLDKKISNLNYQQIHKGRARVDALFKKADYINDKTNSIVKYYKTAKKVKSMLDGTYKPENDKDNSNKKNKNKQKN